MTAYKNPNAAPTDLTELVAALRDAAHPNRPGWDSPISWTGKDGLFWRAADVIEALEQTPPMRLEERR